METFQRWILLLCCGAVLYGVVENLLPRQGVFPVIKAVLTLYIILILLSPGKTLQEPVLAEVSFPIMTQEVSLTEQSAVLDKTAALLRGKLSNALQEQDVDVQITEVSLQRHGQEIRSVILRLRSGKETDCAAVEQLCDSLLGVKGTYEWENG